MNKRIVRTLPALAATLILAVSSMSVTTASSASSDGGASNLAQRGQCC